jgi:hypothetical protein
MTTEIITLNEEPIETPIKPNSSLIKVLLWLAVILFIPQTLLFVGLGVVLGIQGIGAEAIDAKLTSVITLLVMTLIAPILTLPLLNFATLASSWRERLEFWAVNSITTKTLITWSGISLIFWLMSALVGEWFNIPV